MKEDKEKSGSPYPAGRSNEGGNFPEAKTGDKHFNSHASTSHRSENDPQGSSMGLGSQPAAVNLDKGEVKRDDAEDKPQRGEGDTNTPGYGASNNAASV